MGSIAELVRFPIVVEYFQTGRIRCDRIVNRMVEPLIRGRGLGQF